MFEEVGAREAGAGLELMLRKDSPGLLKLRVDPGVLGRGEIEAPGLAALPELVGGCTDREIPLLGGRLVGAGLVRPMDGGLAGARLTLGGVLTLGAGAGAGLAGCAAGACRLTELPPPEPELFRSALSPKTGPQSRIKTEMSARIPILIRQTYGGLTSRRYSIANMICLLSANGSTPARRVAWRAMLLL